MTSPVALARMSPRHGDIPFDPAFPTTPAERMRVQEQLSGIFRLVGELNANVANLARNVDQLRDDLDDLRHKMDEDRIKNAPALGWASAQRKASFWGIMTIGGAAMVWIVTQSLGWLRGVFVH